MVLHDDHNDFDFDSDIFVVKVILKLNLADMISVSMFKLISRAYISIFL